MGILSKKEKNKKQINQLSVSMQINTLQYYWLYIFISIIAGMSNCLKNFMLSCFFKHLKSLYFSVWQWQSKTNRTQSKYSRIVSPRHPGIDGSLVLLSGKTIVLLIKLTFAGTKKKLLQQIKLEYAIQCLHDSPSYPLIRKYPKYNVVFNELQLRTEIGTAEATSTQYEH